MHIKLYRKPKWSFQKHFCTLGNVTLNFYYISKRDRNHDTLFSCISNYRCLSILYQIFVSERISFESHLFLVSKDWKSFSFSFFQRLHGNWQRIIKYWLLFNATSIQKFTINSQFLSLRAGTKQIKINNR